MADTSGYYKLDGGNLRYGPNMISLPNGVTLTRAKPAAKPVDGWSFFDSREEAYSALKHADCEVVATTQDPQAAIAVIEQALAILKEALGTVTARADKAEAALVETAETTVKPQPAPIGRMVTP